jgi:hypothetical protein
MQAGETPTTKQEEVMLQSKIVLLAAGLLIAGSGCQMMNKGPQLKNGMQRSAVGFGWSDSTAEDALGAKTDVTDLALNVTHGWFLNGNAEVGGKFGFESTEVDTATTTSESDAWILSAFGRWYFAGGSNLYPYVEGLLGWGNVDSGGADDDFLRYSAGVGAMNFMTPSTALDAILKFQVDSFDESDVDVDGIILELAYSVFW